MTVQFVFVELPRIWGDIVENLNIIQTHRHRIPMMCRDPFWYNKLIFHNFRTLYILKDLLFIIGSKDTAFLLQRSNFPYRWSYIGKGSATNGATPLVFLYMYFRNGIAAATGWSKETVTCNMSLTYWKTPKRDQ